MLQVFFWFFIPLHFLKLDAKTADVQFRRIGKALAEKIDTLFVKTIKGPALQAAQCVAAMCPSTLQTTRMCLPELMVKCMPLVDKEEWAKYTALPKQLPPPNTTASRVHWWKVRFQDFPKLAPVCIAYLLCPKSSAQSERSFSHLRHEMACS